MRTFRETGGRELLRVQAETMATAIRIGNPASWKKALRVLQATDGTVEQVSEVEIALAKAEIGADGIGCEPASAVTLAGLKKLLKQGFVQPKQTVVLILTGHLLKDPEFTLKFHRGDLFSGSTKEKEARSLSQQQRAPVVLEVNSAPKAVIKVHPQWRSETIESARRRFQMSQRDELTKERPAQLVEKMSVQLDEVLGLLKKHFT